MKLKKSSLFLLFLFLFIKLYGQAGYSYIDTGTANLVSTAQTREIDKYYKIAENKIRALESEVAQLRLDKKRDKNKEEYYRRKIDTLNKLTTYQSTLISEKNKIISDQGTIIQRKDQIISDKDDIIQRQNTEIDSLRTSNSQKDKTVDSLREILAAYVPLDKPQKKHIITLFGKSYKANETILIIEFDNINKPIITNADSIKLAIIYSVSINEKRSILLMAKYPAATRMNPSQIPGGEPWPDKYSTPDFAEILRTRLIVNFTMSAANIKTSPTKEDIGRRVFVSLSFK